MTTPPGFKRRTLVKALAAGSLFPLLGSNLIGCSDGSDNSFTIGSVPADFNHGVASGDPLTDRVILWTRVTPTGEEGPVQVEWQLAEGPDFANIIAEGAGATSADVDYTVKVDAEGLQPGTAYYYRFKTGDKTSPTGKTRTLPQGAVAAASFAVVSCSNYPAGFFNVYREVANQDIDAVLHLGDYLYEYAADGYASERAEELGRVVEPANEIITLSDYRTRYAQYHRDEDLQAAHAAHPFIVSGTTMRSPTTAGRMARKTTIRTPRAASLIAGWPPSRPGTNGCRCARPPPWTTLFTAACSTVTCWIC